jgi:hypothetical protein
MGIKHIHNSLPPVLSKGTMLHHHFDLDSHQDHDLILVQFENSNLKMEISCCCVFRGKRLQHF